MSWVKKENLSDFIKEEDCLIAIDGGARNGPKDFDKISDLSAIFCFELVQKNIKILSLEKNQTCQKRIPLILVQMLW